MSHSNSSLNCFATCMAKYKHSYILHTPPCIPPSPHLTFGTMAHEVLYKAGVMRDEYKDGLELDYVSCIPSEVVNQDLKTFFQIKSWRQYFLPVIKKIAEYEEEIMQEAQTEYPKSNWEIHREVRLQMSPEQVQNNFATLVKQPFVGIIDFLVLGDNSAVILDYKFSDKIKGQDDFDQNSQLPLYAAMVSLLYGIPERNIKVGYVDIPKKMFDQPTVLTNGTLSRSKSQNCSADMYKKAVQAIHGDDETYNCEPGGYYYECWCNLQLNKAAYLTMQYLDQEASHAILRDLMDTAYMIDFVFDGDKLPYLRKYSSYSCKGCEYLAVCKPWLTVGGTDAGD